MDESGCFQTRSRCTSLSNLVWIINKSDSGMIEWRKSIIDKFREWSLVITRLFGKISCFKYFLLQHLASLAAPLSEPSLSLLYCFSCPPFLPFPLPYLLPYPLSLTLPFSPTLFLFLCFPISKPPLWNLVIDWRLCWLVELLCRLWESSHGFLGENCSRV